MHPVISPYVSEIIGVGGYLPDNIVTNHDLAQRLDTSDEWIQSRVGIKQRHIAAEGELTSHLATKAAFDAIAHAASMHNFSKDAIDLIIVATTTPDYTFPATAALVQHNLGIKPCAAFDIQAVCSGFVYALHTADQSIRLGHSKCALVIGAETMSRLLDWTDRTTCVLFGDGAGAFILKSREAKTGTHQGSQIYGSRIYADGSGWKSLATTGGPSQKSLGVIAMNGREVFKAAVVNMANAIDAVLEDYGMHHHTLDWVVPHQANQRILDSLAERLKLPTEKVISTIAYHANTSAATIPLAFKEAIDDGRIQKEHKIILTSMGGGFTWGAMALCY